MSDVLKRSALGALLALSSVAVDAREAPPAAGTPRPFVLPAKRFRPAADAERFFGPTVAEGVSRASAQFAQAADVAKKAMGQMFDMLQSRNKS